ncbi:hypothetical protein NVP1152O_101 [Vibrio phage 1.152.O._10N.222.46.E1]|uniref:Uncharacterized protein n=5 Tax=Nahantvirus 49C7 TaxID=2846601 RepID=A0A2I7RBG4_9CAUD|nr:hypothetical protein HYP57_gp085 [Vibrio phage 1.026.O._10N.222.49.C7]AUR82583.1 hypothetical protein NVP1025O_100 [Vibrio phage 1.025.O._10N.222.46.B6]AUR90833.1 hypothetical protein NVP1150O_100 [Vibrio phage 1.150.O._10N.222.46.A6]AUR91006.1 hypothetical protein NVP1152O_101 [Vibrio phage 1.152.O._10N.222.46.E1]AUS02474.1 hypothetical protein NVP2130O_100 [Vibrio phage 2.130.O._10N.222.46.C2]AUR82691.1 hypothetical protein NVP1026O_100 [Vibrio phage 1.026.O._10N.222.49.C7]
MTNANHLKNVKDLVAAGVSYEAYVKACVTVNVEPCHVKFYK